MLLMFEDQTFAQYRPALKKWSSRCTTISATIFFIFIIILLALFAISANKKVHIVFFRRVGPIAVTDEKFLSIAVDTSVIANNFKHFDVTDPKIVKLMKALAPAYLRIGGTMADRLTFTQSNSVYYKYSNGEYDGGECSNEEKFCDDLDKPNFTMNAQEWLKLNRLAQHANLNIIFDLNSLKRLDDGSWDSKNAEELISFSNDYDLDVNWELGNEPNAYIRQFNYKVHPEQLAKDFMNLKEILKKYSKYRHSLLVGPDITRPQLDSNSSKLFLKEFLKAGGGNVLDAITWHQYYFNGATAKIVDFLDPEYFDILKWQIDTVQDIVADCNLTDKLIWLGETSSAYGGGAPHMSNRFVATFLWLDKLGLAAKNGLDIVIRQSFVQGYYALVNNNYNPSPDWWVSILYKKLVGQQVVDCHMPGVEKVRLYCHCTKEESYFENVTSVTVFGINLSNRRARIRFEGPMDSVEARNLTVHAYILTTIERIDSRFIYMNDEMLCLLEDDEVPDLEPKVVVADPYVEMPAYSLAFWVVPTGNLLTYC